MDIKELKKSKNVAELLDEDQLNQIGQLVLQGYEVDEDSRTEWRDTVDKAMDIAKQIMEPKSHPFPNASNVKYPLITKAAIDFASRTYPEIVQNDKIVKGSVIGQDPTGVKQDRALRVSKHMSYQLLQENEEWEEGMDKLLHILPLLGTAFKKTYYNPITKRPISELCHPEKIVVNYGISSLESARRITHVLAFHSNDIIERIRSGIYLDIDVDLLSRSDDGEDLERDAPIELLEQHCYLDLDEDGYQEPYVVIAHKESGKVLRIVNRFKSVSTNSKGEVQRIEPVQYFTDYHFIKSPDGGFYSTGLGNLLYPINAAINTLINQLIDAGTLNNSQGGFVGRGLRMKNGEVQLKLGEWRVLDAAAGTDIARNIVPLPTKEPSQALFSLLGLLIDVGKDLASANDALMGKQPAQNVPATTMLTLVEQGMKVFNAINKRIYRSLKKEFNKIFDINSENLHQDDYILVLDDPKADVKLDYNQDDLDILPVADPAMASDTQRIARAQAVMGLPMVNPRVATKHFLEALQIDGKTIEELVPPIDPNAPPAPDDLKTLAEVDKLKAQSLTLQAEAQDLSNKNEIEALKLALQRQDVLFRAEESAARIRKMESDALHGDIKIQMATEKKAFKEDLDVANLKHKQEKAEVDTALQVFKASQEEAQIDED